MPCDCKKIPDSLVPVNWIEEFLSYTRARTAWYFGIQPISHNSNRLLIHIVKTTNWYRWEEIRYERNLCTNISPIRIELVFSLHSFQFYIVWCVDWRWCRDAFNIFSDRSICLGQRMTAEEQSNIEIRFICLPWLLHIVVRMLRFVCLGALKCQAHHFISTKRISDTHSSRWKTNEQTALEPCELCG